MCLYSNTITRSRRKGLVAKAEVCCSIPLAIKTTFIIGFLYITHWIIVLHASSTVDDQVNKILTSTKASEEKIDRSWYRQRHGLKKNIKKKSQSSFFILLLSCRGSKHVRLLLHWAALTQQRAHRLTKAKNGRHRDAFLFEKQWSQVFCILGIWKTRVYTECVIQLSF